MSKDITVILIYDPVTSGYITGIKSYCAMCKHSVCRSSTVNNFVKLKLTDVKEHVSEVTLVCE